MAKHTKRKDGRYVFRLYLGMDKQTEEKGTNKDGSLSEEYCIYCFKEGEYVEELTLEEAIAQSGDYADMAGVTKEEAIEYSSKLFPTLKRWKKA